jgi:hypothetical protein
MLAACQREPAVPESPVPPTPFPEIATTPSFQAWAIANVLAYRENQTVSIGFGLEILAPSAALESVSRLQYPLLVGAGPPPPDWFSTPLGYEGIVLAVNRGNRTPDPSLEQLAQIFSGRISNWEVLGGPDLPIQPIIPLRGDALRETLGERLLGGTPFTPASLLGPSPEIMLSLIRQEDGAIGVLPLAAASNEVRLLRVSGIMPSAATVADGEYLLSVELLGIAPEEPNGVIRDWMVWLQSRLP